MIYITIKVWQILVSFIVVALFLYVQHRILKKYKCQIIYSLRNFVKWKKYYVYDFDLKILDKNNITVEESYHDYDYFYFCVFKFYQIPFFGLPQRLSENVEIRKDRTDIDYDHYKTDKRLYNYLENLEFEGKNLQVIIPPGRDSNFPPYRILMKKLSRKNKYKKLLNNASACK